MKTRHRTTAEARDALSRFCKAAWGNEKPHIFTIPVNEERDADVILSHVIGERDELLNVVARLRDACAKQNDEVSQILGKAFGYPRDVDDPTNFPGATEAEGVCVGEHVAETLAEVAARRIEFYRANFPAELVEKVEAQTTLLAEAFRALDDLAAHWHGLAHECEKEVVEYNPAAIALCQTPRCRALLALVERLRVAVGVTDLPAREG